MKKHVSSLPNILCACFVLKSVSSENSEDELQVDLSLQMLFVVSQENISKAISWKYLKFNNKHYKLFLI